MNETTTTQDCTSLLKEWEEFCRVQCTLHDKARAHFRKWNLAMAIPAILLTSASGAANIGMSGDVRGRVRPDDI